MVLNWNNQDFYEKGLSLYTKNKESMIGKLSQFMSIDGTLNGSFMQENWFPQIETHIFISHSHSDEKQAITLAGWLFDTFGIRSFIDSCIWKYADDLLKVIDEEYCLQIDGYYSYKKRNSSTSHIHMMLATALTMMIDKTECLFFLNTPNSINTSEAINEKKTKSPWIYSEIAATQIIRKKIPGRRYIHDTKYFSKGGKVGYESLNEDLRISYDMDLSHLTDISIGTLMQWGKKGAKNAEDALDVLYEIKPIERSEFIHG